MKFVENSKKLKNLHFLKIRFFAFFGLQKIKKIESSKIEKCKNLMKQCQIFIASYQRRVLNIIFGSSEPSRKIFFSDQREVNL